MLIYLFAFVPSPFLSPTLQLIPSLQRASDKLTSPHLPCRPLNGPDLPLLLARTAKDYHYVLYYHIVAPRYLSSLAPSLPQCLVLSASNLSTSSLTSFNLACLAVHPSNSITSLDCLTCNHYFAGFDFLCLFTFNQFPTTVQTTLHCHTNIHSLQPISYLHI